MELGSFNYDIHLEALPAGIESVLCFQAQVGQHQIKPIKLNNYSKTKAEFTICVSSKIFNIYIYKKI